MAWQTYIPHAVTGTTGSLGLIAFMFRDSLNRWLEERRKDKALAREERAIERGKGSNLENKLLSILERDLAGNMALLTQLNATMGDFRDIARRQAAASDEILLLAKETRESQKWLERQFGPGGPRA